MVEGEVGVGVGAVAASVTHAVTLAFAPRLALTALLLLLLLVQLTPAHAIAGGIPAKEGEFAYAAAFVRKGGTCTAIILTDSWLLTAAHCYTAEGRSKTIPHLSDVYAGVLDVAEGCGPHCQHRESRLAHIHPHFRPAASRSQYDDARHNDLALLMVDKALRLDTPWVRSAVRSSAPTKIKSCKLAGFGLGAVGRYAFAPGRLLMAQDVLVLPAKLCPPARVPPLPRAALCSDSKIGVAPCLGDAGGPVVCDGLVVGMAVGVYESQYEYKQHVFYCGFFKSCSMFGLYTSLEPYAAWIESIVFRSHGIKALDIANITDPDKS